MELPFIHSFVFNPFQENTYVLISENHDCVIIDPGNWNANEMDELEHFLDSHELNPKEVWLTHAHIDHILGLSAVQDRYGIEAICHPLEIDLYRAAPAVASNFGLPYHGIKEPNPTLADNLKIEFNEYVVRCIHAPGHSPGSIAFYFEQEQILIGGDVLFFESIGRTDLPGGDHQTLLDSIQNKIYTLPDTVEVYSGHGMKTEIGYEKMHNMFVRAL